MVIQNPKSIIQHFLKTEKKLNAVKSLIAKQNFFLQSFFLFFASQTSEMLMYQQF